MWLEIRERLFFHIRLAKIQTFQMWEALLHPRIWYNLYGAVIWKYLWKIQNACTLWLSSSLPINFPKYIQNDIFIELLLEAWFNSKRLQTIYRSVGYRFNKFRCSHTVEASKSVKQRSSMYRPRKYSKCI